MRVMSAKVPVRKFTIDGSNRPVRPRSCSTRATSDPINIDLNEWMNSIEEEGTVILIDRSKISQTDTAGKNMRNLVFLT